MKWSELTTGEKILFVTSLILMVAYMVLTGFSIFGIDLVPKAVPPALFGCSSLCDGIIRKSRKQAIIHYVLAALWFVLCLLCLFS